jgi:hypothetical protein
MASGIDCTLASFLVGQTWCFHVTSSAFSFTVASGIGIKVVDMPQLLGLAKISGD